MMTRVRYVLAAAVLLAAVMMVTGCGGSDDAGSSGANADETEYQIAKVEKAGSVRDIDWESVEKIPIDRVMWAPDAGIRANLFKCGNKTVHRHYISWKRVNTAQPNFHVTEAFGTMSFEQ